MLDFRRILSIWKAVLTIFYGSHISKSSISAVSSVQVYLSLLRMYLSPPDAHCLGPIKMELSEPQANLQAALQVLELHHSKLNTTKVRISLSSTTQLLLSGSVYGILLEAFFCLSLNIKTFCSSIAPSTSSWPVLVLQCSWNYCCLEFCPALWSGISRAHHIQYPKGLLFSSKALVVGSHTEVLSICTIKSWMMCNRILLL